jgi:protein involved in polysaccharide export with SLBB domain
MALRNMVPRILVALMLAALPSRGAAQQASDSTARRLLATRPELTARLAQLRELAPKADPPGSLLGERVDVELRLAAGDFHAGDRVLVKVEDPLPVAVTPDRPVPVGRSQEQQLSDTFTVGEMQDMVLPGIGRVSLQGLLRSELAPFLTGQINRSIRDPVVHVTPLVSVGVTGEVARPGFYAVPPDAIVSALLNAAGGPTKDAKLGKLKIERAGRPIWEGNRLRDAVQLGFTLDQLRIEPGDVLDVPPKHTLDNLVRPLQFLALIGSIAVASYAVASHIKL